MAHLYKVYGRHCTKLGAPHAQFDEIRQVWCIVHILS